MSEDSRKSVDTLRPPEGDEDVYSASTKVGEAAPEILELVRKAEAEAALKAPRVPSDVVENAPAAADVPEPAPDASRASGAGRAALEVAAAEAPAAEAPAEEAAPSEEPAHAESSERVAAETSLAERTEEGIPPLSLLVLAVAAVIAMWLGYQALHAPVPTPANAPTPSGLR